MGWGWAARGSPRSPVRSRLPHSTAFPAARCTRSCMESEKKRVMSICSVCRAGEGARPPRPEGSSSKNPPKNSSKRLPPPRGDRPKEERPPLGSAACTSQRFSVLGLCPGTILLTVTTAGLTPHTSHTVAAISLLLPGRSHRPQVRGFLRRTTQHRPVQLCSQRPPDACSRALRSVTVSSASLLSFRGAEPPGPPGRLTQPG